MKKPKVKKENLLKRKNRIENFFGRRASKVRLPFCFEAEGSKRTRECREETLEDNAEKTKCFEFLKKLYKPLVKY